MARKDAAIDGIDLEIAELTDSGDQTAVVGNSSCGGPGCGGPSCNSDSS